MQADGNVLLSGMFVLVPGGGANSTRTTARLLGSTGQLDTSFPNLTAFNVNQFLVQPDGNIVLGGQGRVGGQPFTLVQRILPDGTPDPTFTPTPSTVTFEAVRAMQRDAAGRLYVGGQFAQFGSVTTATVARLLANGTPDPAFTSSLDSRSNVYALALQPNGRLLAGGALIPGGLQSYGSVRLLANGTPDPTYTPLDGPNRPVFRLLVQPDGAIVAAGAFTTVAQLPYVALTRLLDANVLHTSAQLPKPRTQAWPVPAHGTIYLRPDMAAGPRQVLLLDATGRVVRRQSVLAGPAIVFGLEGVPPGVYTLRTEYQTGGWVSQGVAVE